MLMRTILLSICLGLLSLNVHSQSKLAGAGKATKLGGSAASKTAETKTSAKTVAPVRRTAAVVRQDPDAKYASSGYMEITGVRFGNVDNAAHIIDKYGAKLYADEVRYLKPQLSYNGLASKEKDITVYVKILREDGTLEESTQSPEGYTYKQDLKVETGNNHTVSLLGWGSNFCGFSAGLYGFEIWYNGKLIYQTKIRLYSGSHPLVQNDMLRINNVYFGSEDSDDNTNIEVGDTLYEGEVKYLIGRMSYYGKYLNEQDITLYTRLFLPSGEMSVGSESPLGFTRKQFMTVKPGSNVYGMNGWGNDAGTLYREGTHKYEIWLDGEKIYETTFDVKKREGYASYLTVDSKTAVSTSFTVSGGKEVFYVNTDASSWEIIGVPSWCEVGQKTASSFALTCKPNTGEARSGWMKVKAGDIEVRIDVKQPGRTQHASGNISGTINGHDYVDLGLPSGIKWATCNVGASKPEECGNYYAWGETVSKTVYTDANSAFCDKTLAWLIAQDVVNYSGNLKSTYDPASKYWSSTWRMPTLREMGELVDNCTWMWGELHGMGGFYVTGPNGNAIFLPASGWYNSSYSGTLECVNERSEYWTSTAVVSDEKNARCLFFMKPATYYANEGHFVQRSRGLCVRPVSN